MADEYPAFDPAPEHGDGFYRSGAGTLFTVEDDDPDQAARCADEHDHEVVLVLRLDDDKNPKKRYGYDSTGRYTRVPNTSYKCVRCGVESGTSPAPSCECNPDPGAVDEQPPGATRWC